MASKLKEMDHVDVVLWNPLDPTAWQEASQGVRPQLQSADLSVDAMLAAGLHIAMTRCNGPCFSLEPSSTTYAAHPLLNHHCQLTVQLLIIFTICHSLPRHVHRAVGPHRKGHCPYMLSSGRASISASL